MSVALSVNSCRMNISVGKFFKTKSFFVIRQDFFCKFNNFSEGSGIVGELYFISNS